MNKVSVSLDLPDDLQRLRMPKALDLRLTQLLDRQDQRGSLTRAERREAEALADLAEMLTLLRLRAERATGTKRRT